jgi:hypothetical protein
VYYATARIKQELEELILSIMLKWSLISDFDRYWIGYDGMEDETGIQVKEIKQIMKHLRDRGVVEHLPCVNHEFEVSGSGNFVNREYFDFCESAMLKAREEV